MLRCKHCGGLKLIKRGIVKDRQRYGCKLCGKTFRLGDDREKYDYDKKIKVLKWYLEGVGVRSISRVEEVPVSLIIHWLRNFAKIVSRKLSEIKIPNDAKKIQILELDEMFSYVKKNETESIYGLLWTESETKLLILK